MGKSVRLGNGNVDFDKFFILIRRMKYNGPLILQCARSTKKGEDFNELYINLKFIKKFLNN